MQVITKLSSGSISYLRKNNYRLIEKSDFKNYAKINLAGYKIIDNSGNKDILFEEVFKKVCWNTKKQKKDEADCNLIILYLCLEKNGKKIESTKWTAIEMCNHRTNMQKTCVTALQCPCCKDFIYSRANHDYHSCTCERTSVDCGFDYLKINFKNDKDFSIADVKSFKVSLDGIDRFDLYYDWCNLKDNYGIISNIEGFEFEEIVQEAEASKEIDNNENLVAKLNAFNIEDSLTTVYDNKNKLSEIINHLLNNDKVDNLEIFKAIESVK